MNNSDLVGIVICLSFGLVNIPFVIGGSVLNAFSMGWRLAFASAMILNVAMR